MPILKLAAGALVLLCAGCGLFPASSGSRTARLPREDADFSKALAHFAHGILLEAELGRDGEPAALASFRQAAALDATNALLSDLVIGRLWNQGEQERALDEARHRARERPSETAYALVASLAEAMGQDELAAEYFGKAAEENSIQASRWRAFQARAWIKAESDRKALRVLKRIAQPGRGRPTDFSLPFYWGQQLVRLKPDGARARPFFELALRCATNSLQQAAAHEGLAAMALRSGQTNDARRAILQAIRVAPGDPARIQNLIRFEFAVHGPEATNRWLRQVRDNPRDPVPWQALAHVAAAQGNYGAACRYVESARESLAAAADGPLPPAFYSVYGNWLEEANRPDDAEALLLKSLDIHPDSAMLQNHLAYFWSVQNVRLDEAENLVRRALAVEPGNGAFLDTLGWIFYRQGRYADALEQLLLAARTEGGDPTILDHLGDVCLALGRRAEALRFWRRSLRIDPASAAVAEKIRRYGDGAASDTDADAEPSAADGGDAVTVEAVPAAETP